MCVQIAHGLEPNGWKNKPKCIVRCWKSAYVNLSAKFTLWGFTDAYSWRGASEPLIFDVDYQPRPAYFALQRTLQQP